MENPVRSTKQDKLQTGRQYLQTTTLTKDNCLQHIKNSRRNSIAKTKQCDSHAGERHDQAFPRRGYTGGDECGGSLAPLATREMQLQITMTEKKEK